MYYAYTVTTGIYKGIKKKDITYLVEFLNSIRIIWKCNTMKSHMTIPSVISVCREGERVQASLEKNAFSFYMNKVHRGIWYIY